MSVIVTQTTKYANRYYYTKHQKIKNKLVLLLRNDERLEKTSSL